MISRDVTTTAAGTERGVHGPSFLSSKVADIHPVTTRGVCVVPCSSLALKLSHLVSTSSRGSGGVPLVALGSLGSRSCRKMELPGFVSTLPTSSCRAISPSPCSWLATHLPCDPPPIVGHKHVPRARPTVVRAAPGSPPPVVRGGAIYTGI